MCFPSAKTQTCEGKSQSCEFPQVRFGTQWPPHGPEHSWLTQPLPSLTIFSASGPASCQGYWVWSWPGAQSIGWFYVCKGATPFLRSLLSWLFVFKFILWTGSHGDTGKALSRQKPFRFWFMFPKLMHCLWTFCSILQYLRFLRFATQTFLSLLPQSRC